MPMLEGCATFCPMNRQHLMAFLSSFLILGCGGGDEGGTPMGEPAAEPGPDPAPDMGGPEPDEGPSCTVTASCPVSGQCALTLTEPMDGCEDICGWPCTSPADCPGGLVSTDGGVADGGAGEGACFSCELPMGGGTGTCLPLTAPDSSCTLGETGFPCDGMTCNDTDAFCVSFTGGPAAGFCTILCEP